MWSVGGVLPQHQLVASPDRLAGSRPHHGCHSMVAQTSSMDGVWHKAVTWGRPASGWGTGRRASAKFSIRSVSSSHASKMSVTSQLVCRDDAVEPESEPLCLSQLSLPRVCIFTRGVRPASTQTFSNTQRNHSFCILGVIQGVQCCKPAVTQPHQLSQCLWPKQQAD